MMVLMGFAVASWFLGKLPAVWIVPDLLSNGIK
jgi:hypothetical protein